MSDCWCCDRGTPISPRTVFNRPGLSALKYRVGTFSSFRRAMLESIANEPQLRLWTSRAEDDYGIEIIELWAYLADILTFYQERIANEAFLRTVVQRDSVMKLAALIDYALAPGVAATAYLAFTVDKTNPAIPASLRVQSKPASGQSPATFETEATMNTSAAVNQVRVWSVPTADLENYGANNTQAIVLYGGSDLKVGQSLIYFAGSHIEEKKITDLTTTERGQQLTWSPPIATAYPNGAEVYRFGRKFQLFGSSAPPSFAKPVLDSQGNIASSKPVATDFSQSSTTTLYLDGVVKNLEANSQVLVIIPGDSTALFTITAVKQVGRTFSPQTVGTTTTGTTTVGALSGTVTQIDLQPVAFPTAVKAVSDIRTIQVYELTSGEISFSRRNFGGSSAQIPAGTFKVYSDKVRTTDLTVGSLAMIADDSGQAEQITITKVSAFSSILVEQGITIEFTPPLTKAYDGETAELYGNVVKATHGETVKDETLGSGDGTQASQTFTLKKSPVTYTPDATAARGAKTSLQVAVDGVYWTEATNFFGREASDRIYVTSIDDDDALHIQFGDGLRGARLPTGVNNIHAKYRKGWGTAGSVAASKLTTLLDAKPGLKSATNPAPSFGWAEPETLAEARQNAPTTVLTFDRAVSLLDFENLARTYPGVGKARAAWVWDNEEQIVQLTCAAGDGASIVPIQSGLLAYLDARRDPNRQLNIADFTPVGIKLHVYIVVDPNYDSSTILANAQAAVGSAQLPDESYGFFAFERLNLDEDIHLSEVYAALQNATGVVAVEIDELHRKDDSSVTLQNIVPIGPAELAMIEAAADVLIELKSEL